MSLSEFDIICKLGEGAYSIVHKVRRKTDQKEYALKQVKLAKLNNKEKENALNEVRILASVKHPNVISYKQAFFDDPTSSLWQNLLSLVMEFADNGDLYQKILQYKKKGRYIQEKTIWSLLIQLLKGLKALHDLNIFHRDLKSANVFLNRDGSVKLGDMNVSKVAKQGLLYTQTGTPYYASPEVWRDKPYNAKSDMWSLGCVLYEASTLVPPFRAEDMKGLYRKVVRGEFAKLPRQYSQELGGIINLLLQVDPHKRPTCNELLQMPQVANKDASIEPIVDNVDEESSLLGTIYLPKKLQTLTNRLPQPNYEPRQNFSEPPPARRESEFPSLITRRQDDSEISMSLKKSQPYSNRRIIDKYQRAELYQRNKPYRQILRENYGALKVHHSKYAPYGRPSLQQYESLSSKHLQIKNSVRQPVLPQLRVIRHSNRPNIPGNVASHHIAPRPKWWG